MADLEVQPRIDSESLSLAFEQNLRKGEEVPFPGRGGVNAREQNPHTLQTSNFGYQQDPLLAQDEDADSWLVPSPGPATGGAFDMSPPKQTPTSGLGDEGNIAQKGKDTTANVQKAPDSQTKKASKIPRVAQLASKETSNSKSAKSPATRNVKATAVASQSSHRGSVVTKDAGKALRPWRTTPSNNSGKKESFDGTIDALREDISSSKIPSRPGSAASTRSHMSPTTSSANKTSPTHSPTKTSPTRSAIKTSPTRSTAKASTVPAAKSGSSSTKASVPAASRPGSKSLGVKGAASRGKKDAAARPVPLLTAISGPEEEFAAALEDKEADSQGNPAQQELVPVSREPTDDGASKKEEVSQQEDDGATTKSRPSEEGNKPKAAPQSGGEPVKIGAGVSRAGSGIPKPGHSKKNSNESQLETPPSKKSAIPRPEWVDVGAEDDETSEPDEETEERSRRVKGHQVPKVPSTPFKYIDGAVVDDKPPTTDRPGVGRHKADVLPDKGYSKPEKSKTGCFGCAVM